MKKVLLLLLVFCSGPALSAGFDHTPWDGLLQRHVRVLEQGQATTVDYAGMARERAALQSYLKVMSEVNRADFDRWSLSEQLAFLINAYNAWTVELILGDWPDLDSIKDLGSLFRSPWSKDFIPLLGQTRSLDDVEHGLIRGSDRYRDPRIHFAVNCASIGCPALRAEAYRGELLEQQLEEQTRLFLADRSRNRKQGTTLQVSSIFKWYREDFEKGWKGYTDLAEFFAAYAEALDLSAAESRELVAGKWKIRYLSYDWDLNSTP